MLEAARRSAEALSADADDCALDGEAARFSAAHFMPALLAVVRSEQTSGAVTEAALAAILKLLQLDFLGGSAPPCVARPASCASALASAPRLPL